jgi:hypothetical protein
MHLDIGYIQVHNEIHESNKAKTTYNMEHRFLFQLLRKADELHSHYVRYFYLLQLLCIYKRPDI